MGTISTILSSTEVSDISYIVILYTIFINCKTNIIQGCVKFYLGTRTQTKNVINMDIWRSLEHNELNSRSTFIKFGRFIKMLNKKL